MASWVEHDKDLVSTDPLQFTDTKPYKDRLTSSIAATGLKDALIVGSGRVDGIPTIIAAMEYAFIGGSMGVVVGEKIARGDRTRHRRPLSAGRSSAVRAARA